MSQFVVVYNRLTGSARIEEFTGASASERALDARFNAERTASSVEEVAVLSAPSRAALKRTHSRYFEKSLGSALSDLAAAGA